MRFKKTLAAVGATAALAGGTAAAIPAFAQSEAPGATDDTAVEAPAYPGARSAGMLESVATVLGMDPATLADQLRAGDTLTDIAAAQGVPIDDVKAAIVNGATERLTAAVTDGRITQEHADEELAELDDNLDAIVNGELPLGRRGGFGHHGPAGFRGAGMLESVATVLGMDPATLADQLRAGDTLTDIAAAQGVPIDDVKAAIVNGATERLTAAVSDGRITQEHADEELAELDDNLDAIVNGELPLGRRGGFGHHGPAGFGNADDAAETINA